MPHTGHDRGQLPLFPSPYSIGIRLFPIVFL